MSFIQYQILSNTPDLNADLSRLQSSNTRSLIDYCKEHNVCVNSMYQSIDYTYCNDAINSRSLIDHFIVSDSLCDNVNKYCTMDDVDNMSDHLPIVMHTSLPVNSTFYSDVRQFIPKPKWSALTEDALKSYHDAINQSLNDVDISKDLIECRNVDCTVHKSMIASLYNKIIAILTVAAKHAILSLHQNRITISLNLAGMNMFQFLRMRL